VLLPIINKIILPIFVLMTIGFLGDRLLDFDLRTLSRALFYIMSPATIFIKVSQSELRADDMLRLAALTVIHLLLMYGLSRAVFSGKRYEGNRRLLALGSSAYNSGNYGLPLMLLAFGDRGLSLMAIVFITNAVMLNLGGTVLFVTDNGGNALQGLRRLLTIPLIYALPLALIVRALGVDLPPALAVPISRLDAAYIGVALLTLGAQLSRSAVGAEMGVVALVVALQNVVSPLVVWLLVRLFGFTGVAAQVLIVMGGLPTAINTFVLASEFDQDAELASRMVFWTTLFSAVTISILLVLVS
jgi:predicted permease